MDRTWLLTRRTSHAAVRFTFALALLFVLGASPAGAVMPKPEIIDKLKAEGRFEHYKRVTAEARRRGLDQPDPARLAASAAPVLGNLRALVLLVDFTDHVATAGAITDTAFFHDLLFSTNTPRRSLNDYYQENSYGKVSVDGDVVGWLRMPQTYAYYVNGLRGLGGYPQNSQKLAADAIAAADLAGVDFSAYDNDGNGQMDGFFVVHAGPGFEETGDDNDIHSHKWQLISPVSLDGVTISNYTMQPEEQGDGVTPVRIGVFCHEFGHFYGLPDLYDVDGSSQGLDEWVLMAAGNWSKSDGSSPAHFGPWSKIALGWVTPITPSANVVGAVIPQAETDSVVYRLWTNGAMGTQYFLIENRQRVGFDAFLPGGGLLIYHVDDAIGGPAPNTNEWYPGFTASGHYKIALEQADGGFELEKSPGTGPLSADNSDPYPGFFGVTSFDDLSTPDSRDYDFLPSQVAVWDISPPGSTMTANFDVTWSRPNFQLQGTVFTDDGDDDGTPDPGERARFEATYRNYWLGVSAAQLSVSTDDPELVFVDSIVDLGAVPTGATVTNGQPIVFDVPPGKRPRVTDFYVTITADGGSYVKTDTMRLDVGPKQILLVDDDDRLGPSRSHDSTFIVPVLNDSRVPFARWEVFSAGVPADLQNYPMVLWYTGNNRADLFGGSDTIITPSEVTALTNYLDAGGNLFITGQQIARYLDSLNRGFLNNYLKADYAGPANDFLAWGVAGDVVSDSTKFVLGGAGGAANQVLKDLINPLGGAVPIYTESNVANVTGIRYDGAYKLVFLGWGVEGIGDDVQGFDAMPKSVLVNRVSDWLLASATDVSDDGQAVVPNRLELLPNYPNPFNPSTTIGFVVGPRPEKVRLTVFNILGQHVRLLADGMYAPGRYEEQWDGRDGRGRPVSSGVYFYRLEAGDRVDVRKMVLLK